MAEIHLNTNVETISTTSSSPMQSRFAPLNLNCEAGPSSTSPKSAVGREGWSTLSGRGVSETDHLKRHPDLWFDDGSIILKADTTLFKVHISQLARHSVIFRDMFAMPQPSGSTPSSPTTASFNHEDVDGATCPTLELYDSAEDLGNLLTALYDGPTFGNNDRDDFRAVSGILRLASKYIIDTLRVKALSHLSEAWPSSLRAWDMREDLTRVHELQTALHPGTRYPSPVTVINLAREIDAPSLLPSAFYDLSRYQFHQILEAAEEDPLHDASGSQQPFLSLSDTQRLALGKESAQQAITTLIQAMGHSQHIRQNYHRKSSSKSLGSNLGLSSTQSAVCVSAAACRKDFSELVDLATQHYLFDRERGASDPLYVAEELGQLKSAEFSECVACARSLENWAAKEREKLWKLIPLWFRLELSPGLGEKCDRSSSPWASGSGLTSP